MRLFELIYSCIIIILLIIYFTLCNNTNIIPLIHLKKFKISKIDNLSNDDKFNHLIINIIGLILTILLITFELNYMSHNHNSNIYIRLIQFIVVFCILLLIYTPNKSETYNKLSNSFKPLIMGISVAFTSSFTSIFLLDN